MPRRKTTPVSSARPGPALGNLRRLGATPEVVWHFLPKKTQSSDGLGVHVSQGRGTVGLISHKLFGKAGLRSADDTNTWEISASLSQARLSSSR